MDNRSKDYSCSSRCEEQFKECLSGREHESVCRMKRVQCDCGCTIR
jgi:hypothetical protein